MYKTDSMRGTEIFESYNNVVPKEKSTNSMMNGHVKSVNSNAATFNGKIHQTNGIKDLNEEFEMNEREYSRSKSQKESPNVVTTKRKSLYFKFKKKIHFRF